MYKDPSERVAVSVRIEFEISAQDFLDGQRLAVKNSPVRAVRWTRVVMPIFGLVLLLSLAYTVFTQGLSPHSLPGLAFGLFFALFFILTPLMTKRKQRSLYAKSNAMDGRLVLEVDDDGIQFEGPVSEAKMSWAAFSKFFEDDKSFIYFQRNGQIFHMLPKRFLSLEQTTAVREFFERHIGSQ
jgi:hypothetical protein